MLALSRLGDFTAAFRTNVFVCGCDMSYLHVGKPRIALRHRVITTTTLADAMGAQSHLERVTKVKYVLALGRYRTETTWK